MESKHVPCGTPGCQKPATYKIAAPWSDGRFTELKTYGLACLDHFGQMFRDAQSHRRAYSPTAYETVGEIGIYRCGKGHASLPALRLKGLEETCRSWDRAEKARNRIGCA
jgi:hypothetical protein